jgi:hypothetical protein
MRELALAALHVLRRSIDRGRRLVVSLLHRIGF